MNMKYCLVFTILIALGIVSNPSSPVHTTPPHSPYYNTSHIISIKGQPQHLLKTIHIEGHFITEDYKTYTPDRQTPPKIRTGSLKISHPPIGQHDCIVHISNILNLKATLHVTKNSYYLEFKKPPIRLSLNVKIAFQTYLN